MLFQFYIKLTAKSKSVSDRLSVKTLFNAIAKYLRAKYFKYLIPTPAMQSIQGYALM